MGYNFREWQAIKRILHGDSIRYFGLGEESEESHTIDGDKIMETKAEVIARLAKQGGYILLVGGGLAEMGPPYTTHPQIIIWDDQVMNGTDRRAIPSNTRAILCSKWIGHTLVARIQRVATQLHSVVFPQLTKKEIRDMLVDMIHEDAIAPELIQDEQEGYEDESMMIQMNEGSPIMEQEAPTNGILMEADVLRAPKRGELDTIFAKELRKYDVRAQEAHRLLPIISKQYGIKANHGSLVQAIMAYERRTEGGIKKPVATTTKPTVAASDDFAEAEKILKDAKAAIDLMLDFMPKLRKEMDSHRKRMAKLKSFFVDED